MIISPSAISPYKIPTFQSGGGVPPFSFGNALKPDGFNDLVSIPSGGIAVGSNDFTISFWVKVNWAFSINVLRGVGSFDISQTVIAINDTLTGRNFTIPSQPNDTWIHVFFAFDFSAQKGRVWVDGVESSTGNITVRLNNCTFDELINQNAPALARDFAIDEIAIWRGELGTPQNAIDLYNSGNGTLASDVIPSPLAYWRCNEADGALELVDETGTYNGTLTNFSTPPAYFIPHGEVPFSFGNALEFDGVNDYVTIGSNSDYKFASGGSDIAHSMGIWLKMDNTAGFRAVTKYNNTSNERFSCF